MVLISFWKKIRVGRVGRLEYLVNCGIEGSRFALSSSNNGGVVHGFGFV